MKKWSSKSKLKPNLKMSRIGKGMLSTVGNITASVLTEHDQECLRWNKRKKIKIPFLLFFIIFLFSETENGGVSYSLLFSHSSWVFCLCSQSGHVPRFAAERLKNRTNFNLISYLHRIHCSAPCKMKLESLGGYHLEERGKTQLKVRNLTI